MGRRTIILLAREVPTVVEELGEETHDEPFQGSACISCFVTEKILNRFLPRATPELNAMDHLWRHVKGRSLANQATQSIDESTNNACQDIFNMSPRERLCKAGILSGNFWLTM